MKSCSQIWPVYLFNFQGRWMESRVWLYAPFSTTFTSYIFIYMHQRAARSNYSHLAGLRAARGVKNALFIYCSPGPRRLRQTSLCASVPLLCNSSPSVWKGRDLTSYLIFPTAARGSGDKRPFKKSSSYFYKPFVRGNIFTKAATVSPVYDEPCIPMDGRRWEN